MTHSIPKFNLEETDRGEMVIPSETGNIVAECNLRQFLIQSSRNYSKEALDKMSGMKVSVNRSVDEDNVFDELSDNSFVFVNLLVKPETDLQEFVDTKGDEFFDELMAVLGYCDLRGVRGNRAAFVTEFKKKILNDGTEVLEAKILLSTSVFYNDYRVTVAYPHTESELDGIVESIYNRISNRFPEMKFETYAEFIDENEPA